MANVCSLSLSSPRTPLNNREKGECVTRQWLCRSAQHIHTSHHKIETHDGDVLIDRGTTAPFNRGGEAAFEILRALGDINDTYEIYESPTGAQNAKLFVKLRLLSVTAVSLSAVARRTYILPRRDILI